MYHQMKVYGFTVDPLAKRPLVLLKGEGGDLTVALWISMMEAASMAAELVSRDLASQNGRDDLLSVLVERLGMRISSVTLESPRDGAVAATVLFVKGEEEIRVEVRTCEALLVSLKFDVPLFVSEEVVARASIHAMGDETVARENDARRLTDYLERLDPADLGKYPM